MKGIKDKIEFEARLKKIEIYNDTLQIIVFPRGSLKEIWKLYEIRVGQKIKVSVSLKND